jgi:hypothetical protein
VHSSTFHNLRALILPLVKAVQKSFALKER